MGIRELDRKKAYAFIKRFAIAKLPGVPTFPSDEGLDDTFAVSNGTFRALRLGEIDPPRKLIENFENAAGPLLPPEASTVIIRPFRANL